MAIHDIHIIGYDLENKKDLFIHAAIKYFGVGMMGIFLPALLFQTYGLSLAMIFLFFGLASLFIIPLHLYITGNLVSKYGSKWSMLIGICMLLGFLICLGWLQSFYSITLLCITALLLWWFTAFYWTGYHYDMSQYAKTDHFGSKVANLNIIITISSAIAPLLAGLIIDTRGLGINIMIAITIVALSLIPLMRSSHKHKAHIFTRQNLGEFLYQWIGKESFITFGALSYYKMVSMIIRPLLIFLFVGNYTKLWLITTITTIITVTMMYILGKYMDQNQDKKIMKAALFFESVNRLAASITLGLSLLSSAIVWVIDLVHRLSSKSAETTLSKALYTSAHDNADNPIYMIVIHEISHHTMRAVSLIILAAIFTLRPYNWLLIIPVIIMLIAIPFQYMLYRKQN